MADVTQLKINNTSYGIKDDVARSAISGDGGLIDIIEQLDGSKQDTLVSGTNIKTVDSNSLLGSGNLTVFPVIDGTGISPFDSITIIGVYRVVEAGSNSILLVQSFNHTVTQTLISNTSIRTRSKVENGVWGSWQDLIKEFVVIDYMDINSTVSSGIYGVSFSGNTSLTTSSDISGLLLVDRLSEGTGSKPTVTVTQTLLYDKTYKYRTKVGSGSWSAWTDVIDLSSYAPLASPALTGTPTAPTAASGTNTTQVATTAFVQNALSNMGAGGSEMVDVTITGTTSAASFSTNPYNAIKAVVDDGKIAVLNASVDPLSTTGVLIPVYEYTYSQSGRDFTGYKGKIQNGNYEISVDVQSTSSATVTITSVGSSITVDTALSESSTNPVQNRVITAQILENEEIVATALNNLNDRVELKQDQLVSGTTIKTINNQSILGSGNITISGGGGGGGGEENVIEVVKVNGTALTPDANKAVNVVALQPDTAADLGQGTLTATNSQGFDFIIADEGTSSEQTLQDALDAKQPADFYIVNFTENNGTFTADKTFNEVVAALDAGKVIIGKWNEVGEDDDSFGSIYSGIFVSQDEGYIYFVNTEGAYYARFILSYDNSVTREDASLATQDFVTVRGVKVNNNIMPITNKYAEITLKTVNSNSLVGSGNISVGTYSKPSGGIPASDLASAVQTSLGKADTALQSYTETDPVFTASAAHGISSTDISNWNAKGTYSKPSGGIPDTDLATAVSQRLLPEGNGSTDDGKIVQYSYTSGGWQMVKPITIYTGSTAPSSSTGSNGDIYIQTS